MGLFSYSKAEEGLRDALRPVAESLVDSISRTGSPDSAFEFIAGHADLLKAAWRQIEADGGRQKADKKFEKHLTDQLISAGHRANGRAPGNPRQLDKFSREILEMVIHDA